ncbi:MAG TPA: spermidine/putrescine ABC transporter substrate-binding protein, partial [Acidimicrobiia bacterium]|nr:spermidine/putrescine ABC transporter substrate-binding protein [Acidimicrobiia bacterium]
MDEERTRLTGMPRLSQMDGVDRRQFLRYMGFAAAAVGAGPLLAACGDDSTSTTGGTSALTNQFTFANWPYYIDPGGADSFFETSTLDDFKAATGITVSYIEEINDNIEWFGKVQGQLAAGQNIGRDLAALTDWMADRFIRLGYVEKLDKSLIPNAANLRDALKSPSFDPTRDYTLPWQSGLTALAYDPANTGRELTSINDIFDPAFSGRVTMLSEANDTIGLVMLGMGLEPATARLDDAQAANDKIRQYVASGHIRRFTGNDYGEDLLNGNVWVAFAWSGDVIQLQADNPDLRFLIPDEGLMLWSDNMLIPKGAVNKAAAETFMNYVYDPEHAAKIESYVNYICP